MDTGFMKIFPCIVWVFALFIWIFAYFGVQLSRLFQRWNPTFQQNKKMAMQRQEKGSGFLLLLDLIFWSGPYVYPIKSLIIWMALVVLTPFVLRLIF
jgi:hypothetical protein